MSDRRRAAVLTEAIAWLRTPYHHMGRLKGGGIDCLMLLAEVYEAAGVIPHLEIPFYPPDWHLHRGAERYLDGLTQYASEIDGPPEPGDAVLFRFGRCFAHGAIIIGWPRLIHAWHNTGVVYSDADQGELSGRAKRFFCPFSNA